MSYVMTAERIHGVIYAEDFDAVPPLAPPEPTTRIDQFPEPPLFTFDDLEAARAAAREEGILIGRQERARDEAEAMKATEVAALSEIGRILHEADMVISRQATDIAERVSGFTLSAMEGLFPTLYAEFSLGEIHAIADIVLSCLSEELSLEICVSDRLAPDIESALLKWNIPQRITLCSSPTMQPGDLQMRWKGGKLERNLVQLHDQIRELFVAYANVGEVKHDQ
jgi:hypothetical protein